MKHSHNSFDEDRAREALLERFAEQAHKIFPEAALSIRHGRQDIGRPVLIVKLNSANPTIKGFGVDVHPTDPHAAAVEIRSFDFNRKRLHSIMSSLSFPTPEKALALDDAFSPGSFEPRANNGQTISLKRSIFSEVHEVCAHKHVITLGCSTNPDHYAQDKEAGQVSIMNRNTMQMVQEWLNQKDIEENFDYMRDETIASVLDAIKISLSGKPGSNNFKAPKLLPSHKSNDTDLPPTIF